MGEQAYITRKLTSLSIEDHTELNIAFQDPFIDKCGNIFAKALVERFPDTSFNITMLPEKRNNRLYSESDITFISLEYPYIHKRKPKDKWKIDFLFKVPVFVWLGNNHPLLQLQTDITFEDLRKYPFCIYRHSFHAPSLNNLFYSSDAKIANTPLYLEKLISKLNYFTIDCLINNSFLYKDILNSNSCTLIKTSEKLYSYLIYRNSINHSQIDYIKNFIQNILHGDSTETLP